MRAEQRERHEDEREARMLARMAAVHRNSNEVMQQLTLLQDMVRDLHLKAGAEQQAATDKHVAYQSVTHTQTPLLDYTDSTTQTPLLHQSTQSVECSLSTCRVVENTSTPVRPLFKKYHERTVRRQLPHNVTHNQDMAQTKMTPENILPSSSAPELLGVEPGQGLWTLPSPRRRYSLEGLEEDVQKSVWSGRASVRGAEFRLGSEERESLLGIGACDLMLTARPGLEGHTKLDDVRLSLATLQASMQHHVDERKKLLPVSHRCVGEERDGK
jgi:hypothetical protein